MMTPGGYYKLDPEDPNAPPIPTTDPTEVWPKDRQRQLRQRQLLVTRFGDEVTVSTVFLGVDHGFDGATPVLWETMIFGGPYDGEQWRYASRGAAIDGHFAAVALVEHPRE